MSNSSAFCCRNGHPILAGMALCRTCGAPITTAPAQTPASRPVLPAEPKWETTARQAPVATRQEALMVLWTLLAAAIGLVVLGVVLAAAVGGLG